MWPSPMTKVPTPTENSKKKCDNTTKRNQKVDNTTIADRLGKVSLSNNSHSTVVVKPVYERSSSH